MKNKMLCLVCSVLLVMALSVPVMANQKEIPEELKSTIVYDENGKVDAKYYEDMQYKLIDEFEKKVKKEKASKIKDGSFSTQSINVVPGDVFVSFSGTTSGIDFALVGHASLVETSGGVWCISSWPGSKSPSGIDGVQYEYRYWDNLSKVYGLRVNGSTSTSRQNAVNNATAIVSKSPRLPYNWFFLNKFTTNSYYCSQLVWRAWSDAGINIDRFPYDTVVSPAELTGSHMTTVYYKD
ncbi:hypothetical protein [Alkaliphilus hydrothermalis]|uniref:Uncharacterized protein YycO n=1 Tax=Alkaliphilus hydrothermalis TaxID=1482730 RepID=A0ABS2NNJ4_9FIRM|nr:hypothetical protein [Alkaliphilus hydrothermalis]MBM7614479.1 uncharacterized protein YycO [Alkaliphilus hydrothermalis]